MPIDEILQMIGSVVPMEFDYDKFTVRVRGETTQLTAAEWDTCIRKIYAENIDD